jgi:trypsin-like peptidase
MRYFFIILLFLASTAEANVLRLVRGNGRAYCSCVCVGRDEDSRVWVCARHCVPNDGKVTLFDPETKQKWAGTVDTVGTNSFDLAVFRTSLDPQFHGVWIAEESPKIGDEVFIVGYPGGGLKMSPRATKVTGLRRDGIVIKDAFIGGESGGGLFNQRGELVGIVSRGRNVTPVFGIAAGPASILRQMVKQENRP